MLRTHLINGPRYQFVAILYYLFVPDCPFMIWTLLWVDKISSKTTF